MRAGVYALSSIVKFIFYFTNNNHVAIPQECIYVCTILLELVSHS